ncbi:hypothetical protein WN51_00377 [Melipona quadrifasciata]|uniref:Uncharacterized protein n=1 Tax=Melipona quadrifasciata TaxID=166423 RepID=A0A0M9A0H2_9HYME|nr:hypothetical protein WN51_00377 [Melipona quadrifasciata]
MVLLAFPKEEFEELWNERYVKTNQEVWRRLGISLDRTFMSSVFFYFIVLDINKREGRILGPLEIVKEPTSFI